MLRVSRLAGAQAVDDADLLQSASELSQTTFRSLIRATVGVYLAWHFGATINFPATIGQQVWTISIVFGACALLTWRLLGQHLLLAQLVWQIGLLVTITASLRTFGQPEIAFLYALLPLMAVIATGSVSAVVSEAAFIVVCWLAFRGVLGLSLPLGYIVAVAGAGLLTGLLGWSATQALYTVTQWSLYSLKQARHNMQSAQESRAQLARVVKDLDQAYYRLERANASLVATWRRADDAERFRAEFATNVSHELRTPLNLIIGFSEMMITSPESYGGAEIPGPYRSDLNAVHRNAQHLLSLVDDVLDMARIDAGRMVLAQEETDLEELSHQATSMVQDYVQAKGLELIVNVAKDLPKVWADPLRVRQVLLNLLVNAARFTERGHIAMNISARTGSPGDPVRVEVADTGRGIADADMPKIFQEFRTTQQPLSTWHSGTGLGLPISKRLVELQGGEMGVESALNQGTTFWFTLPRAPEAGAEPDHAIYARLLRGRPTAAAVGSERFVVALHDDPLAVQALQRYLPQVHLVAASSWKEAAELAGELRAVAVLADTEQPLGELGAGCAKDLPVVRCDLPSNRKAAAALGASDLLVKPVSRQRLREAIQRLGRPVQSLLVADDDPDLARMFLRMLQGLLPRDGLLVAYNGSEALALLKKRRPDLVILDLVMPEVGGLDVLDHMRRDPELADTHVILVTARGQDESIVQVAEDLHVSRCPGFQLGELAGLLNVTFQALSPGWGANGTSAPTAPPGLAGLPVS